MKTLENPADMREAQRRLRTVSPAAVRRWGVMSPHQMVCHLNDSFKVALGERPVKAVKGPLPSAVMKWIALRAPMRWPRRITTMPEVDQQIGGTKPTQFDRDLEDCEQTMVRFASPASGFEWSGHPLFGTMSERDWLRWGYLHVDHHLRQFGL